MPLMDLVDFQERFLQGLDIALHATLAFHTIDLVHAYPAIRD